MSKDPGVPAPEGQLPDGYDSIDDGSEIELSVKGSSFLGQAHPVRDEAAAAARVEAIRRRYHDATHHCWAFRLITVPPSESELERWNDDGEPSGTAGQPILAALRHHQIHDALVVVTRYFGGTKLGTGGLSRAYGEAARQAVAAAARRKVWRLSVLRITCGFDHVGAIEAALARAGGSVHQVERTFQPDPIYTVEILRSRAAKLTQEIRDATAGRAVITVDPAGGPRED